MARYQVILAYDGTEFAGFQRQVEKRTVQGEFESSLRKLGWKDKSILAAGRTDRGVHARGQVVSFDLDWNHFPEDLMRALNANLPHDAVVRDLAPAQADFHPRYDARSRCYRYQIIYSPVRDPFRERFAWRIWPRLDTDRLQSASAVLLGEHDFSAFGRPPKEGGGTVRMVSEASWTAPSPEGISFWIRADGFLYRMVRHLVHSLVLVGQGSMPFDAFAGLVAHPRGQIAQGLAPPQGLFLWDVEYPAIEAG